MDRRYLLSALSSLLISPLAGCSTGGDGGGNSPTGAEGSTGTSDTPEGYEEATNQATGQEPNSIVDTTVIDESGSYQIAEDITSSDAGLEIVTDDVSLDGRGQTIRAENPGPNQHGIRVTGDNVTISNLKIRGWNENGAGILFESVNGGEITNVTTEGNFHGIRLAQAKNIDISNSVTNANGEFGILADASEQISIAKNTVAENVESGILLWESADNTVTQNTIRDNELRNNLGGIHLDGDRRGSNENVVSNNELVNNGDTAIILIDSDDNEVARNRMEANGRHGIFLEGASNNTLENNTATQNAISGIDLAWGSDGNLISANTLENNEGHGIWLIDSHENSLSENSISANDQIGIILADSSQNTIAANTVTENIQGGIDLIGESEYTELVGSHNNEVVENIVRANEGREGSGIRLLHSDENSISENSVSKTSDHGINLFESVDNEITDNEIRDNAGDGVHLEVDVGSLTMKSNVVKNNNNGVAVDTETTTGVSIDGHEIADNGDYGVVVRDMNSGDVPVGSEEIENVDATDNWWGQETGPNHAEKNPSGEGDEVSDNIDFEPWIDDEP